MTYYIVSEDRLRNLIEETLRMNLLDENGIDNWSWYGVNDEEHLEDWYGTRDFDKAVEEIMSTYDKVKGDK